MKHLYLLLLLCFGVVQAQIINIPDANFKSKLIEIGVDTNNDGEIQQIEALEAPVSLGFSEANIASLEGIQYFTNTTYLICSGNNISSLDVSALVNLTYLSCYNNQQLASLNVGGLAVLERLECGFNALTSLNLAGLTALRELYATHNSLSSVDLTGLLNMETIDVSFNALTALDISAMSNLRNLDFAVNSVASINVGTAPYLNFLRTDLNPIGSLDLSANPEIAYLDCSGCQLTELDISNLIHLARLTCSDNQLTSLDFTGLDIGEMDISDNLLTEINVNGMNSLSNFHCGGNLVTTLDFSGVPHLNSGDCPNSPLLTNLNVRNGSDENLYNFVNSPLLRAICADEGDLIQIQQALDQAGLSQCLVSSYCVFNPAGDYNTISGTVRFDADNNGCDNNDIAFKNAKIAINEGTNSGWVFSNATGQYAVPVQAPAVTLNLSIENPEYFNVSPASTTVTFPSNNFLTQTRNFCVAPNGVHPDLEVVIVPMAMPKPGFDQQYQIIYRNKGNQLMGGNISFAFDDNVFDFVSTDFTPVSQSLGNLQWNYANLMPFEIREFQVTLNLNGPTDIPAVNIGDALQSTATITAFSADETPEDNTFTLPETVVGSFDPNEKICLEGASVSPAQIGKYLHYTIHFENTGTAAAQNVVVRDLIDTAKYEVSTLHVLGASHPMQAKITGNKVEFIYEGILLGPGEHGYVTFKIKTKSTLAVGSSVSNQADIFFDYNFPVVTDPAVTTFQVLGVEDFEIDDSITIFPNPATDFMTVKANSEIQSVTLFDVQGRSLMTQLSTGFQVKLDTAAYPKGMYFIKVETVRGSRTEKMILK